MTDEERRAAIRRINETLERARAEREQPHDHFTGYAPEQPSVEADDVIVRALREPVERASDRWRREQTATQERHARQRERREAKGLEQRIMAMVEQRIASAFVDLDGRIAQALGGEREVVLPTLG